VQNNYSKITFIAGKPICFSGAVFGVKKNANGKSKKEVLASEYKPFGIVCSQAAFISI
jgi:hypothetical protein